MFTIGNFRFQVATTPDMLEAVHRLRYQVYVEENQYEKPEDHPGGLEKDGYDPGAIHLAALDRDGVVVGTLRLILNSDLGLPALKHVEPHYQDKNPASRKIVEVSRFALARSLKGEEGDDGFRELESYLKNWSMGKVSLPSKALAQRGIVLFGLINLLFTVLQEIQATDLYMMAERRLWLLVKDQPFRQVSPEIDYHGNRACYLAQVADLVQPILGLRKVLTQAMDQTPVPDIHRPMFLPSKSFDLAGVHFQMVGSDNGLEKLEKINLGGEGTPNLVHLAALDGDGRVAGRVTLSLNPTRGSKKEGAIAAFSLAPEFRVPLQAALDDGATGELSVRECRKAAMVALGLFRLVYWVGKQLRLTAWRVELAESQARFLEQQGVALHAMGSTTYQIRLSEVEERLLDFQGLRESFQEILNQRNVKTSSLGEFLNRVGSDSPFGENLEEAV